MQGKRIMGKLITVKARQMSVYFPDMDLGWERLALISGEAIEAGSAGGGEPHGGRKGLALGGWGDAGE
jgi:hypothetical protein